MSVSIGVAHVQAYTAEIQRLSAQMDSLVRGKVRIKDGFKGKYYNFERLGASDLAPITARHSATTLLNPEHSRRRASMSDRGGAVLLDRQDDIRILIQPKNDYARNHAESVNRYYDDLVFEAALGNATAVDAADAASNVALPAGQKIAASALGLTFAKVNSALTLANLNHWPYTDRYFAISPAGLEDLLNTTQATSADFANLKAIQSGKLEGTWMSFNWIVTTRLALASTTRSCIAWHKNGLGLCIGMDLYTSISTRNDLNDATQVYAAASAGATRVEDELVVQVDIVE